MPEEYAVKKVASFGIRPNLSGALNIDFSKIQHEGYQIIRGFGVDTVRFESELNRISGGKLFFSTRIGCFVHEFRVLPYSDNLSEQANSGGFHTDFMFQTRPPEFIALLCLNPDPKHPIYGRNQVVHRDSFLERMSAVYSIEKTDLLGYEIEYQFPNRASIRQTALQLIDDDLIFKLHTSLMPTGKIDEFGNVPLKAAIEAVCGDIAQDIVLDRGDLLIVSNHIALHRRTECTLAFNLIDGSFRSREMATIRFDR